MLNKLSHEILEIAFEMGRKRPFTRCLLAPIENISSSKTVSSGSKGLIFDYKIPSSICRSADKNNNIFSTAAAMALFDEVSTYSLAVYDRNHRPGVTAHLSCEMLQPLKSGEDVVFITKCDKIGRNLAFCSLEVRRKTLSGSSKEIDGVRSIDDFSYHDDVLMRGCHVKYLPMGAIWDLITHPVIFPIFWMFYKFFYPSKTVKVDEENSRLAEKVFDDEISASEVGSMFHILKLTDAGYDAVAAGSHIISGAGPEHTSYFSVHSQKSTNNLMGNLHGGAVAASVEHACIESRENSAKIFQERYGDSPDVSEASSVFVKSLEVQYMSPMKGDLVIAVADDLCAPSMLPTKDSDPVLYKRLVSSRSYGNVLNRKSGQICAQFVCHLEHIKK